MAGIFLSDCMGADFLSALLGVGFFAMALPRALVAFGLVACVAVAWGFLFFPPDAADPRLDLVPLLAMVNYTV
jgi:hypothetical protein